MSLSFLHPGGGAQAVAAQPSGAGVRQPRATPTPPVDLRVIVQADRACCCTAKPSVLVIMPPTPGRQHQTELLLCWHHYRASRQSLAAAGAIALGCDGDPVPDVDWPALQPTWH
jgi:hypothetical protein